MKIKFIINPFQNLIYHLERASESFKDLFSEKYKVKANSLTPASTFIEFARALNQTIISRSLKQRLSDLVMPDEIPTTVNQIFSGFAAKITEVLLGDVDRYLNVFREELQPKLESYQKSLKSIMKEIEESFKRIETLTLIPFKFDQLEIFLVDALSEEYGSISEILGLRSLALGIMHTTDALKEIALSLAKLNLGDIIRKNLPEDLNEEEEQNVNNALAKLIANEIQNFLNMPLEVKNKVDEYITLLWADWKNYVKNPEEYRDIGHFFRAILLPRILGEAPEIEEVMEEVVEEEVVEEESLEEEVVEEESLEEEVVEEEVVEEEVVEEEEEEESLVEEVMEEIVEEEEEEEVMEEVVEEEEEEEVMEEIVEEESLVEEVMEEIVEEESLMSEKAEMLDKGEEVRRRREEEEEEARWRTRSAEEVRRRREEESRRRREEEEARWRTRSAEEAKKSEEEM